MPRVKVLPKYEYLAFNKDLPFLSEVTTMLNEYGIQGWRLVDFFRYPGSNNGATRFIFERELVGKVKTDEKN